jgi:hypothetical protein
MSPNVFSPLVANCGSQLKLVLKNNQQISAIKNAKINRSNPTTKTTGSPLTGNLKKTTSDIPNRIADHLPSFWALKVPPITAPKTK